MSQVTQQQRPSQHNNKSLKPPRTQSSQKTATSRVLPALYSATYASSASTRLPWKPAASARTEKPAKSARPYSAQQQKQGNAEDAEDGNPNSPRYSDTPYPETTSTRTTTYRILPALYSASSALSAFYCSTRE